MSATNDLLGADPLIGLSPERKELLRRVSTDEGAHTSMIYSVLNTH